MHSHLAQQMIGQFHFNDHEDSVTTLKTCQPLYISCGFVDCWHWISYEKGAMLYHTEEHLHNIQYKHSLKM